MHCSSPLVRSSGAIGLASLILLLAIANSGQADDLSIKADKGNQALSGSVKFENDERLILETSDGAWSRIAKSKITAREVNPAPEFLPPEELGQVLQDDPKLEGRVRTKVSAEVVAILVLESDLGDEHNERVAKVLDQMIASYERAADGVRQFAKKSKLTQKKPSVPAVVVMFESQQEAEARKGDEPHREDGIRILEDCGWYNPGTNWASFSMPEVISWEGSVTNVLIWQQLFHTGILKRHAPVPLWFLAGVAAGFDATENKVEPNHLKLNSVTFPELEKGKLIDWNKMVTDYDFYLDSKDIFFDDYRDNGWAIHWYMITKNKAPYARYWKIMTELSPLDDYSTEKAAADFKKAFVKDPDSFKPLFTKAFKAASANPPPPRHPEDAFWRDQSHWGTIQMTWIDEGVATDMIRMDGKLTNACPLRTRSFCVGFTTNWGKSGVWFVDKLEPQKSVMLKPTLAVDPAGKPVARQANRPAEHEIDNVWILSAYSDSPEAEKWRKGELPTSDQPTTDEK